MIAAVPAVRLEHVTKRFPGVLALSDVSIEIAAGSCHALCGENGAGKSTLGKLVGGIHAPDEGRLFIHGKEVRFATPRDALDAGVGMVHQELAFCENLSVAENLTLGAIPARRGFVDFEGMDRRADEMLAEIGMSLDVRRPLGTLPIAQQQMVQIAAAVGSGASVVIFDEPTSSLSQGEVERLFDLIGRLKQRGVTCIYVSHRMPEIFKLCDAVSILRDGRHVSTRPVAGLTEGELVRAMIGRPLSEYLPAHLEAPTATEQPMLDVRGLSVRGKFRDVSFAVRPGEIVGLAGLVGAGRSEVACAVFGLEPDMAGDVRLAGRPARCREPREAIALGIGFVPEDRKRQGLVLSESAKHNTTLPLLSRLANFTWIRREDERTTAREYFDRLRVRAPGLDTVVAGLSGGNQQKILLARWLAAKSKVLILDEPTRGVDVGAKAEIHALIGELASQGKAILLISSELPELLSLSNRILVLREGRIVGEVPRAEASEEKLLRLMAGL
jgi:ABC-type sugar transport system ATPase subunit